MTEERPTYTHGGPRPNSGGARPGAGRKTAKEKGEIKRVRVSFTLPPELVEWLREQDKPASQLVEEALAKERERLIEEVEE